MEEFAVSEATYEQELTPEVAIKVEALKQTIDMHDSGRISAYGKEVQTLAAHLSDFLFKGTGTAEVSDAGELLKRVIDGINGYNDECSNEKKMLFGLIKKKPKIQALREKYFNLSEQIDIVAKDLLKKSVALSQICSIIDNMLMQNKNMYESLTIVICAGKRALADEKSKIEKMKNASCNALDVQRISDFSDDIARFERRLNDLELTHTMILQQIAQMKLLRKSAEEVSKSIRATIVTAIPLWKNQMTIALGMQAIRAGLSAVNDVKEATNEMLITQSQMNKQLSIEAAQAVESGVININTLNEVNKNLIDSLNESYAIAQKAITSKEEGAKKLPEN